MRGGGRDGDFQYLDRLGTAMAERYRDAYLAGTRIPREVLDDMMTRDLFMAADTYLKWGVVDRVLRNRRAPLLGREVAYYGMHPEYRLQGDPLLWKTSLNHVFLRRSSRR